MHKAYIILAHKNLDHLLRLIHRLDDGRSDFYIHIDLKTILPGNYNQLAKKQNVNLIQRISTQWGGFSLAEATLNAMKEIRNAKIEYNAISLLSGQDYPIKSNMDIDEYIATSYKSVFLDYFPLPDYHRWPSGGTYRYKKYFFGTASLSLFFSKTANLLAIFIPFLERRLPPDLKPYCGSQWWTIDMHALNYVLDYIERHPEYLSFHKYTFAPDEIFFHMIWLNSRNERLQKSILNDNLRFLKWKTPESAHPEILTEHDFEKLCASKALFARKFDDAQDRHILDLIDQRILSGVN